MQFSMVGWVIDVDREATITAYERWILPSEESDHAYNRNYIAIFDQLPAEFAALLHTLGIDYTKLANIHEVCDNGDGTHMFMGWYHVIGRRMAEMKNDISKETFHVNELGWHQMSENCSVMFTDQRYLLAESFPNEVLQVNFSINIPWIGEDSL